MVTTRTHPLGNFDQVAVSSSPSKNSSLVAESPTIQNKISRRPIWIHTPSNTTLIWICFSVPLVLWDCAYLLFRPHSLPGGKWHDPVWTAYDIYAATDYSYSPEAYEAGHGWALAQCVTNLVESASYLIYLYYVYQYGVEIPGQGRGAPSSATIAKVGEAARVSGRTSSRLQRLTHPRKITGRLAASLVLLGFSTALITLVKTVLYVLQESFSSSSFIGRVPSLNVILFLVLPSSPWLLFPAYMSYVFGAELLQGLAVAANDVARESTKK